MNICIYDHATMESKVVKLWNECCHFDLITIEKFRKQIIFDENFRNDLCYVATENNEVVGFALGAKRKFPYLERGLEPDKGWINVIFVKKEYRNLGIGHELLKRIEEKLKNEGVKEIIVGAYSPNYFFAGLDPDNYPEAIEFFSKENYLSGETHYSMGMDLHGYQVSEKTQKKRKECEDKGYSFKMFTYDYSVELLDFLGNEFGGGWKRNALIAMQKGKAEERIFLVVNPNGKICGCANRAIDDNEMRFGPIGIAKSERNNGIGTVLLELAMEEMVKRGIYHMFFVTTDEKGKKYYDRVGLHVIRRYISYSKELS